MQAAGLEPALDELVMFARWVTPAQLRRRFDTRFFAARLPTGQTIHPQEGEVTDWLWTSPQRALASAEITLVYATRAILESVVGEKDAGALLARAHAMRDFPVIEPRIVRAGDGWRIER